MTAGLYDFKFEQGATFRLTIIYKDSEGVVVNLTGYSARLQIRESIESQTVALVATTANGRITITGAEGKIQIVVPAADTEIGNFQTGVYDLEIESADGTVTRLVEGQVFNSLQVTR